MVLGACSELESEFVRDPQQASEGAVSFLTPENYNLPGSALFDSNDFFRNLLNNTDGLGPSGSSTGGTGGSSSGGDFSAFENLDYLDDLVIPGCRPNGKGNSFTVDIEDYTGEEHTTSPAENPERHPSEGGDSFFRYNVRWAAGAWYSSVAHGNANNAKWVDYVPSFKNNGVGLYQITGYYRATDNRAKHYPAHYEIWTTTPDGRDFIVTQTKTQWVPKNRADGWPTSSHTPVPLKFVAWMCEDSFVRVRDYSHGTGSDRRYSPPGSISFSKMEFRFLGTSRR